MTQPISTARDPAVPSPSSTATDNSPKTFEDPDDIFTQKMNEVLEKRRQQRMPKTT